MLQAKLVAVAAAVLVTVVMSLHWVSAAVLSTPAAKRNIDSLAALLAAPEKHLANLDIARMNLLCSAELPGSDPVNIERSLGQLDDWAKRVRAETERHLYRFRKSPGEFERSEGFFRMVMLGVVLSEDFQVKYDPARRGSLESASDGDGFFRDASKVFLNGLLGSSRQGTCSSLPVLYAAVGRRLGYPLKLVTTKGHLFVRWDGEGERFNIEVTGQGINRFDDDYYRRWPSRISEEEIIAEGYLKTLSPAEELAVFLSIRGLCWREAGNIGEAIKCFNDATRLAPNCRGYRTIAEALQKSQKSDQSTDLTASTRSTKGNP